MHQLLRVAEAYEADRLAEDEGVSSLALMESAGGSVARLVRQSYKPQPVVVLCGPGNNGGDGFVAARLLAERGWPVRLALLGSPDSLCGDALINAQRWRYGVRPLQPEILNGEPLVIDALFGAGLARPIDGPVAQIIEQINARSLPCIGVDMPSGVNGDTGEVLGIAPQCVATATFFRSKPGHFLYPGAQLRGRLEIADIGIPETVLDQIKPNIAVNRGALWRAHFPFPDSASHKHSRGHLLIRGGSQMTGAARLAARGARRIGAGLVSLAVTEATRAIYATDAPGHLVVAADTGQDYERLLENRKFATLLLGPGAGTGSETRTEVIAALRTGLPTLLDADALSAFADDPTPLMQAIHKDCVLTPHEGEFARLFSLQGDKLSRSLQAANDAGCVVLLKGADTVIAAPDGRAVIDDHGSPYLATGGTGDVLAGMIASLMAQGMAAFEAACAGVWLHGKAAGRVGPGLIAEDLPDVLPEVLVG